jgi:hypothetical protein
VTEADIDDYYQSHGSAYQHLSPARARQRIRAFLESEREEQAMTRYISDFQNRFKLMTVCATGYTISVCGNYPKPVSALHE